jgi:hypothetical protein
VYSAPIAFACAGEASPGIGHVDGRGFMANVNDVQPGFDRRIVDRHDLIAGKGEEPARARPGEALGK